VIADFNRVDVFVFRIRQQFEIRPEGLDPSLLTVPDENFRVPVLEYFQSRILQSLMRRQRIVFGMDERRIRADRRQSARHFFAAPEPDSGTNEQQIKQIAEIIPFTNFQETAVKIGERIFLRYASFRAADPKSTPTKKLTKVEHRIE